MKTDTPRKTGDDRKPNMKSALFTNGHKKGSTIGKLITALRGPGHGATLARGAIGVFVVKVAGAGLLFGLHVMLARLLGVEQYGIYVYVWTWITILAILCLLGFQTSLVRFIAEYNIKQQWGLLRGILRKSEQFVLGFSLLISIAGAVVVRGLDDRISNELAATFYIALCVLPVFAFARLREASLRALKHAVQAELLLQVIKPVLIGVVVVALFFWLGGGFKAPYAMAANFAAVLITGIIGTVFLHKLLPKSAGQTPAEFANGQWLKVSLPLLLIAGMSIILRRTDILMLGALKGSEQAGIYSAASRISDLVVFALTAINAILAPMISELYHTGQKEKLQKIITLAARAIFVFTLVISIILIVFGKFLLSLFSLVFVVAYIPLLILLAGQIINSLAGPVGLIMSMSGRQNAMGIIISTSAVINIVLNLALIPLLGLTGAAISTALTMIMWNVTMFIYVRNKLGINPTLITGTGYEN